MAAENQVMDVATQEEILRKAEERRFVPNGGAVGLMPTRNKKLEFVSGDEAVDENLRNTIQNLLHLSPYAMCITDMMKPDEPIIYANEMFCKWTEYPEDYIVGRNCRFLQGPATDPDTVKRMRKSINEGTEFRGIVRNYSRTGIHLWNNLVMKPIKNSQGFVTHFTGIQNFSHEPPNFENTPLPPKMPVFNPLAKDLTITIDEGSSKAVAQAIITDLEVAKGNMSPKIFPKMGGGVRDFEMDESRGESPKRRDYHAGSPSNRQQLVPARRKTEDSPLSSPKKTRVGSGAAAVVGDGQEDEHNEVDIVQDVPTLAALGQSEGAPSGLAPLQLEVAPRRVVRTRGTSSRRQGGECTVLPDKDVWLELVMRSLSPENVPMLPPVDVVPPRSTAMSYTDFDKAQAQLKLTTAAR